jgi:transposase
MKKRKYEEEIAELQELVINHSDKLTDPNTENSITTLKNHYSESTKKNYRNCFEIELFPTPSQRDIFLCWLDATTEMSNATVDRINYLRSMKKKWFKINKKDYFNQLKDNPLFTQFVQDETDEEYEWSKRERELKFLNSQDELTYFREKYNYSFNYKLLRSKELMDIKKEIQKKSYVRRHEKNMKWLELPENQHLKKAKIYTHILDASIKYTCASYITMYKNYNSGHIKKYSFKHLKFDRKNRVLEIESETFKGRGLRNIFGDIKAQRKTKEGYINFDFHSNKSTSTLKYDQRKERFFLYVSRKLEVEYNKKEKEFICIDPGVKTPLTCMTEDFFFDFGKEVSDKLYDNYNYLKLLKRNESIPNKIKKKHRRRIKYKTKNLVNNFHWKGANILSKSCNVVYFGNMNIGSILSKQNSLGKLSKKVLISLRFGEFVEKIKYKCCSRNTAFVLVDESFTTKTCSYCGFYDRTFTTPRVYDCKSCHKSIDRDQNSCRNIYLKSTLDKYRC